MKCGCGQMRLRENTSEMRALLLLVPLAACAPVPSMVAFSQRGPLVFPQATKEKCVLVGPDGFPIKSVEEKAKSVRELAVSLPSPFTVQLDGSKVETKRAATATLVAPADATNFKTAIVFGHGFSQAPDNYYSTLYSLAYDGFLVLAPNVDIFTSVVAKVEGVNNPCNIAAKLQTAVITDMLRAIAYLKSIGVKRFALLGHSMGGGCALVLPYLVGSDTDIACIAVLSPYVNLAKSRFNPFLYGKGSNAVDQAAATKLFEAYDVKPPTMMVSAKRDGIVPPALVNSTFEALKRSKKMKPYGLEAALQDGAHIGFEDSLDIKLGKITLFSVWSYLIFTLDAFKATLGDTDKQLLSAKIMVRFWFERYLKTGGNPAPLTPKDLPPSDLPTHVNYTLSQ